MDLCTFCLELTRWMTYCKWLKHKPKLEKKVSFSETAKTCQLCRVISHKLQHYSMKDALPHVTCSCTTSDIKDEEGLYSQCEIRFYYAKEPGYRYYMRFALWADEGKKSPILPNLTYGIYITT